LKRAQQVWLVPRTLKVGLKYCGGCRPQYDRIQLVVSLKEHLGTAIEFVDADNPEAHCILIVTGCLTACAHVPAGDGRPVYTISRPAAAESWIRDIGKSCKTAAEEPSSPRAVGG